MQPFNYQSATDENSAVKAHGHNSQSSFLAGGTNIIDLMKLHVENPVQVVDITRLALNKINDLDHSVEVGALVNNNEMAQHHLVEKNFPFLSEAILAGASVQLRNLATTSGNLLQRTRCSYFRDTACGCNKRQPGTGCSAIHGFNRMHAILGGSDHCIATHASDMCVPLMAMEAMILTHSAEKNREIPISEFYRLPGDTPHLENVLRPGELITAIRIPKQTWFKKSRYVKIRDRASYAFALVSAAVAVEIKNDLVQNSRIAFGGVGTIPWRSKEAEHVLQGQKLTAAKVKEAAQAAVAAAQPRTYNAFKVELARQTLTRALHELGVLS